MEEYKNIYRALLTIKSTCAKQQSCNTCPLRNSEHIADCGLRGRNPESWEVKEPREWRAFDV